MKQWLSLLLAFGIVLSCVLPAAADEADPDVSSVSIPEETADTVSVSGTVPDMTQQETVPETTSETMPETSEESAPDDTSCGREITDWSWVDPDDLLKNGVLTLTGVDADHPVSLDTVISMLPQAIAACSEEISVTWESDEFAPGQNGSFLFRAALPEGWILSADAAALTVTVKAPEAEGEYTEDSAAEPQSKQGEIAVSEANFPDPYFREYITANFDKDRSGVLDSTEIYYAGVINLRLNEGNNRKICSLQGIQNFSRLSSLSCTNLPLQKLDLSNLQNLEIVFCNGCSLTELNVAGCTGLKNITCDKNQLTDLSFGNHPKLTMINCSSNKLTALDLSGCGALQALYCSRNQLKTLDVSSCSGLRRLNCSRNTLSSVNLTSCQYLEELDCSWNQISSLKFLAPCTYIKTLTCSVNQLSTLDLSAFPELTTLYAGSNSLTSVNVAGCRKLSVLDVHSNQILEMDLAANQNLRSLYVSENKLVSLDLHGLSRLNYLDSFGNPMLCLDIRNTAVTSIYTNSAPYKCSRGTRSFDLKQILGFDITRCKNWKNGKPDDQLILKPDHLGEPVSYEYDIGNNLTAAFQIFMSKIQAHWEEDEGGSRYIHEDGTYTVNDFEIIYGNTFYFDENGFKVIGWHKIGEKWHYFDQDGNPLYGVQLIDDKYYYFHEDGSMAANTWVGEEYYGPDGARVPGAFRKGWVKKADEWMYIHQDGSFTRSDFEKIGRHWHYFNRNGIMLTGMQEINGDHYFFDANGYMNIAWEKIDGQYYYFDSQGRMVTGFQTISGKQHYFKPDGTMTVGWEQIGGRWYRFDRNGYMTTGWYQGANSWYYFTDDGSMAVGLLKIGTHIYFFAPDGAMSHGWKQAEGEWYYFGSDGWAITGWRQQGRFWYYFDCSSCAMVTGWKNLGGQRYYFNESGVMAVNQWIGDAFVGSDGLIDPDAVKREWVKENGGWRYYHQDGSFTRSDFEKIGRHWHYFNADGLMVTGWKEIGSLTYYFDGSGYMVLGWRNIGGKAYYFQADGSMARNTWIGDSYVLGDGSWAPDRLTPGWHVTAGGSRYAYGDGTCAKACFERIDGFWYYFDYDGYMVTGWKEIDLKLYYFDDQGHRITGWRNIDGIDFYFDPDGSMATGWRTIGSYEYYFRNDGTLVRDGWVGNRYLDQSGHWVPGITEHPSRRLLAYMIDHGEYIPSSGAYRLRLTQKFPDHDNDGVILYKPGEDHLQFIFWLDSKEPDFLDNLSFQAYWDYDLNTYSSKKDLKVTFDGILYPMRNGSTPFDISSYHYGKAMSFAWEQDIGQDEAFFNREASTGLEIGFRWWQRMLQMNGFDLRDLGFLDIH